MRARNSAIRASSRSICSRLGFPCAPMPLLRRFDRIVDFCRHEAREVAGEWVLARCAAYSLDEPAAVFDRCNDEDRFAVSMDFHVVADFRHHVVDATFAPVVASERSTDRQLNHLGQSVQREVVDGMQYLEAARMVRGVAVLSPRSCDGFPSALGGQVQHSRNRLGSRR